ncbi:type II toxin-antitoxin system PemK/MazF family toxin [Paenibacillus polymyxa]|uniref:type II toxin-antitoxin system PemK/MazF family toxin n=1 Tax=Paenibacillus polymyxa TaxID=1406 RepID=UPI00067650C1|nr:type II toxin-antitoxin system PemK/MazF family toxin [Paenibacillus polymyxa]RPE03300.1 type II toxin-antitoxin system PemK/MazF family toxin [Paenibacillus polymyxa]
MTNKHPTRGDIYWADLKPVKGSEQDGLRPVLIISNDLMNETSSVVLIIPMTKNGEKAKAGPFNIEYKLKDIIQFQVGVDSLSRGDYSFEFMDGTLLCNQSRAVSKNRLKVKLGKFNSKEVFADVKEAIVHSFALEACDECAIPIRPGGTHCPKCRKKHKKKCRKCGTVIDLLFNYCPKCGEEVPY